MGDLEKFLNNCSTLMKEDITDDECKELASAFALRALAPDEILIREGESDDTLSIVVDGDIAVTRDAGGGEFVTLQHLKPGDISGAMGFIDGNPHSATLRATRESHVITLHRVALEAMIETRPQLVYKVMRMIIRSVHKTVMQMNRQFVEMNNYITKEHGRY
jgi:CRP/FNR family cyclic AMP-dependent transcriptional regulator